ncbi:MAG: hypothetical protein AB8E82_19685 [Aureispira sp.]
MKPLPYILLLILCCCASFSFAQNDERLAIGTVVQMTFEGNLVEAKLVGRAAVSKEQEQEYILMNINETLLGAERESKILPINFVMPDEPVTSGILIFGLESETAETLTLEILKKEEYTMVLDCTFEVAAGSSYKVVDLGVLENGTYSFRLKNKQEAELTRIITIKKS